MGCVNGVQNDQNMKNQIKKMIKIMRQYEERINKINQKFILDLQKMVNPSNYQIDEQVILVVENKSECETISSQIECSVKKHKTFSPKIPPTYLK
ncbi:hypothetical protein TTHERM_01511190 (macronuclear) [Tetrahymena thermophila SB210]|uniref:Uncharacterized protein n=1 Tax=Tetrahymena thermophila (strain SB210) TaxID=312017 RepID=Q24CR3_TETTS|nr:hypothetical protein TTHERM_01511190 [Tetrahymena thermophila SB210]EAS05563.2 hypothetical protein TTHERM_01511190 [Tetrahymena thermophila SB210]|eukprot:XP_001025808.2 hypothetical protein TTHERM_01511190 [Tetrahymena thermophila SB210]